MLERGTENTPSPASPPRPASLSRPARFARPAEAFALTAPIDRQIEPASANRAGRDEVSA
jgi:hypothetical protein